MSAQKRLFSQASWTRNLLHRPNTLQRDCCKPVGAINSYVLWNLWARSIQPKFPEISVQNSMDRFGPTGKVSKKRVHLLRWSTFPGRTGWNFGWMDRALWVILSPVYTTENFWHGSGEIGTGAKKELGKLCLHYTWPFSPHQKYRAKIFWPA